MRSRQEMDIYALGRVARLVADTIAPHRNITAELRIYTRPLAMLAKLTTKFNGALKRMTKDKAERADMEMMFRIDAISADLPAGPLPEEAMNPFWLGYYHKAYYTTTEAAKKLGVTPGRIRQMAEELGCEKDSSGNLRVPSYEIWRRTGAA